jgi:O-antigen/teichoic acid export membrane protein
MVHRDPGDAVTTGLRRLLASAAGLTAGRGIASLLSAVWLTVAAHLLHLSDFGDLALLVATTTILINLSDRGLQTQLSIHVASTGGIDRGALMDAVRRRLGAASGCALINAAMYLAVAHDRNPVLPLIAAGSILGTAVYSTVLVAYRATGRARADACNEALSRLSVLLVGTLWLLHGGGLVAAIAVYAGADIASAVLVSAILLPRHVRRLQVPRPDLRLRTTLPFAISLTLLTLFYRIDTYLVGALAGSSQVATYGAAYRILDAVGLPVFAVGSMVFAHSVMRRADERLRLFARLAGVAAAATIPAVLACLAAGGPIMRVLFGPAFEAGGSVLAILMLSAMPAAVVAAGAPIVQPHDRRTFAWLAGGILVLNIASNGILIPAHGALGAAYANLISQGAFAAGVGFLALRQATATDLDHPRRRPQRIQTWRQGQ